MREILFRGAQKVDGSKSLYWYKGSLVSEKDGYTGEVEYYIQNESGNFLVIPETVGQYTGLTDKNGNKIFEGDILKSESDGYIGVVKYNEIIASFVGEINDTTPEFYHYSLLNKGDVSKTTQLKKTEVIGNIHDNPELLEQVEQE